MIAVILAAGKSERFKSLKQLAKFKDSTLLNHTIMQLEKLKSIEEIVVVLGHEMDLIKKSIISDSIKVIYNNNYHLGKSSSVQLALEYAQKSQKDLLLTLVDIPLVESRHYLSLIKIKNNKVVFASYNKTVGVPCIIPYKSIPILRKMTSEEGLKSYIKDYEKVAIPEAAFDIDTKEDLKSIIAGL